MLDASEKNSPELVAFGVSAADQDRAMRMGVSFNGIQFIYRNFKYDRLSDACSYAESDIGREGKLPAAAAFSDWLPRPTPSSSDQALMQQFGIAFEDLRYKFRDYRYDRLEDAVNYACTHQS